MLEQPPGLAEFIAAVEAQPSQLIRCISREAVLEWWEYTRALEKAVREDDGAWWGGVAL